MKRKKINESLLQRLLRAKLGRLTPVPTRIAVEGGLTADRSFALLESVDPLQLTGRPILEGRRWLAIIA